MKRKTPAFIEKVLLWSLVRKQDGSDFLLNFDPIGIQQQQPTNDDNNKDCNQFEYSREHRVWGIIENKTAVVIRIYRDELLEGDGRLGAGHGSQRESS